MAVILAVNAGSSSVKVSLYRVDQQGHDPQQLAEAQVSGLTAPPAKLDYTREAGNGEGSSGERQQVKGQEIKDAEIASQADAFKYVLKQLAADEELGKAGGSPAQVTHVAHRVVHGGDYAAPQEVTSDTLRHLEALTDLAPLHNGAALGIVRLMQEGGSSSSSLPESARNIAVFDSSFHQSMPPAVSTYAIDAEAARRAGLKRYGFHGISYSFILRCAAAFLDKPAERTSIIALHLGSGASACAIKDGKSLDTTMGLTPLSGLPGATRSGDVDPSLVFHLTHDAGKLSHSAAVAAGQGGEGKGEGGGEGNDSSNNGKMIHITRAEELLNKQAGWKALTGTTDFGEIAASVDERPECRLAYDLLVDRIVGYVGAYFLKLGGDVDALVFAGGIGEKAAGLRRSVVGGCRAAGFELDEKKNQGDVTDVVQDVGREGSKRRVLVVQTDEQWEMARSISQDPKLFG